MNTVTAFAKLFSMFSSSHRLIHVNPIIRISKVTRSRFGVYLPFRFYQSQPKGRLPNPETLLGPEVSGPFRALKLLDIVSPFRLIAFFTGSFALVLLLKHIKNETHPAIASILDKIQDYPEIEEMLGISGPLTVSPSYKTNYRKGDLELDVELKIENVDGVVFKASVQQERGSLSNWNVVYLSAFFKDGTSTAIVERNTCDNNEDRFSKEAMKTGDMNRAIMKAFPLLILTLMFGLSIYLRSYERTRILDVIKRGILQSEHARYVLGEDIKVPHRYQGLLNASSCRVRIPISGSKVHSGAVIHVSGVKTNGQWRFSESDIVVHGLKQRIPIKLDQI